MFFRIALAAALVAVASIPARAQTDAALNAEEILQKVEAKLYSPKGAGLKSVRVHVSMPALDPMLGGAKIMYYWQAAEAKDRSAIRIEGAAEVPPMIAGMVKKIDMGFARMFSGGAAGADMETIRKHGTMSATEADGKYILTIKRKAEAPEDVFLVDSVMTISKEYVLEKAIAKLDDQLSETTPTFKTLDGGKLLLSGSKLTNAVTGDTEQVMEYEARDVGDSKVWVPTRVVNKIAASGMEIELLFKDYELNQSIDAKIFEDAGK